MLLQCLENNHITRWSHWTAVFWVVIGKNSIPKHLTGVLVLCLTVGLVFLSTGCTPNPFSIPESDRLSEEGNFEDNNRRLGEQTHTPENHENSSSDQSSEGQEIRITQAIVALRDIDRGASFLGGATGRREWPAESLPLGYVVDEADLVDQAASLDIVKGQVIVCKMLTPAPRSPGPLATPPGTPVISTTKVLVALQDIAPGSSFVAGSVGCKVIPTNSLPSDFIIDEAELTDRMAGVDITTGQVIAREMLTPTIQATRTK